MSPDPQQISEIAQDAEGGLPAQNILEFIKRIFLRPVSFPRLKLMLFPVFVGSLAFDWLVKVKLETKTIEILSGPDGLIIPIIITIIFILLIVLDVWHFIRTENFRNKILEKMSDPTLPSDIKQQLADRFLN